MYSKRRWCTAIPVFSALVLIAHGATIKFDQSQTGDYNLQIHLKNIELYAVFGDSGSSDEDYDLPDYTDPSDGPSKPPTAVSSSTTKAPPSSTAAVPSAASSTVAVASTASTQPPVSWSPHQYYNESNNDKIVQMVEALIASNGNSSELPAEQPAAVAVSPSQPTPATASASAPANGTANRKCGLGYFRDPMGRCRRIRKPHLPFLQMVHTPGVIKSFQPQQRTPDDVNVPKN